ncbi:terminase [Staphylococcus haemolyticus]|uniref:phage tail protein n=1 Tax=Staphylococcus haemolyticus TaxID=1283 RepID=UPI00069E9566|nr:terminase [Staphylococcus haemolyticus]MCC3714793.1 terminase [Staphylococcus haemolyticus]MCH4395313.1 terminase [Staphylococcus haemolyticus]MCH4470661.1 terminase [Staphylococcus haemolyticus]MCH4491791.1 terminase [Staphylococcus haemolyticus]MCH4536182.1 terminase [Staphylococcus haemolyticus]
MDKNFMVRIMANIRDFQNNVRKAQTLAKTSIPDEIETDVKANISKFQRNLQRAKAMAQRWREHKVEIDGDTNPIKRAISFAKAELQRLRDKQVDIKGDNDNLKRAVISAKVMLASLHDKTVHVNFDTRGMTRAQVLTKALGKSLDEYGNKMDALATKIRTFGTVFSQQVRGLMIASIQGLIPVIAGLVPALMAVLNAVGVLAGGILGLAGAFSIAGAGAFAFGGMAISALKMLKDGTLQATAETRRYQASLDQVKSTWESIIKQNQAQIFNTLANGLNTVNVALSRMKPFLAGVSKGMEQASKSVLKWAENSQTASKFFNMMNTTGVKTFNTLLSAAGRFGDGLVNVFTQLGPLFLWVAQGLDSLGKKFQNWANSVAGQNAIKAFIEYTKTNLPKIGQIFGNVFAGIGNLMVAFAQNSAGIFDWLVKMTGKFREWSEQVGKSEGFKQFVKYVQQNGPVIMQLIGNIVRALVAFGTAMAPIASVILRVVTAFAGFIAKLFETHPAVAKMVGIGMILAGIMWALLAPIIAVSTFISSGFVAALIQAVGHIGRFLGAGRILQGILNILRGAFSLLVSPIANIGRLLPLLGTAFSALTGPVGIVIGVILALVGVIVYLWKTNEDFRNMIINAWNGIVSAISGAVNSIINWFTQLWASIQQTLQPIMPLLQQLGQLFMEVLGGLVMGAIQLVIGAFQSLWLAVSVIFTAIGAIVSSVVQLLVGLFTAFIQLLTGDFSGAWLTLQTTIQNVMMTIWNAIVSIFTQISEFIFNTLNSILGTNITSWSQIWSAIVQYVTQIWNSVTQWFGQMAQSVWNKMVQAYNYVVSTGAQWVSSIISTLARFVSSVISGFIRVVSSVASHMAQALSRVISVGAQWVSAIISAMARFVQSVISGFINVVSQVQSGMSRAVNTVRNFIGQFVSAGLDLMRGLVQGIMNGMKWVVNAAKNVAQSAVNAAKSALGIHSPSRVFRGIGQYVSQGLGMGILADQHKAVNAVRSVASNLTDAFKPELSTDLTDGLGGSLNGSVDAHMTKDVRHSMQENNRPIVNITVRNEGDVDYIKSYIEEQNGKNNSMGL